MFCFLKKTKQNLVCSLQLYNEGYILGFRIYKTFIKLITKYFNNSNHVLFSNFKKISRNKFYSFKISSFWFHIGITFNFIANTSFGVLSKEQILQYCKGGFIFFIIYLNTKCT